MAQELNIDVHERLVATARDFATGNATYAGRKSAWHRLGAIVGKFASWRELLAAAKADFTVVKRQLEYKGEKIAAYGTFRLDEAVLAAQRVIGGEIATSDVRFLGTVGEGYQVIQHTSGFEILDRLVGEIGGAHYETMGTLDGGRVVWGQVDPQVKIRVGDDESDVLLTFRTSHDGSISFDVFETIHRIVCRNTFRAANLRRLAASLKVRHSKNAQRRIDSLSAEIGEIRSVAETMQEKLNFLASRRVTRESADAIFDRLFPKSVDLNAGEDAPAQSSAHRDNIIAQVLERYEYNDGNAFPEQRGTHYNLLNAITEYTDHYRQSRGGKRDESATFGSGARLKDSAMELIMESARKAPATVLVAAGSREERAFDPAMFSRN